jgi:hypothetical protein
VEKCFTLEYTAKQVIRTSEKRKNLNKKLVWEKVMSNWEAVHEKIFRTDENAAGAMAANLYSINWLQVEKSSLLEKNCPHKLVH